ncbi:hypothetical protein ACS0TY_000284 [Phlomoides rotata]
MSHSSSTSRPVTCRCKNEAIVVTSWKNGNCGRRFHGCQLYPNDGYCNFFKWIDPPMCDRAVEIIPGLLRRMNEQRAEIRNAQIIAEKLKEMINVLEHLNGRLESDVRALKVCKQINCAPNKMPTRGNNGIKLN